VSGMRREPIVAIATAPGRGAVGIVRVSGLGLEPLVRALCGRTLPARHACYGAFLEHDGSAIDHGLALFFPAPHSYSGEDVLELQAHGGPVLLQLLLARCLGAAAEPDPATGQPRLAGLRLARPGEFTERAYLNGKLDLAQAEAVADLIDAATESAARGAARSLSGAFSQAVQGLRERLIHLRTLVEATLDFPEEEIDFLQQADALGQLQRLRAQLAQVQRQTRQGALLREGIRVVIAGQPNVGKSSLLNALAGAELAIVTAVAGTTRDVLQQSIQIEGVPLHVIDTAGLRASADEVERIGIARAWAQIASADVLLWLRDPTRCGQPDYDQADAALATELQARCAAGVPLLQVWTKADLLGANAAPLDCGPAPSDDSPCRATTAAPALPPGSLHLSARTGAGLDALRQRLLECAGGQSGAEGLYSARARHVQALQRVGLHLHEAEQRLQPPAPMLDLLAEELRLAQNALNEITGSFSADDLLGQIFGSFCIGK